MILLWYVVIFVHRACVLDFGVVHVLRSSGSIEVFCSKLDVNRT